MTLAEGLQPGQITFTPLGDDRWQCDICKKEVQGYRGMGGHKGLHTGQARAKFQRRGQDAAPARGGQTQTAPTVATGGRLAVVRRATGETDVDVTLNLDGTGQHTCHTGLGFLDHMLAQLARHGMMDITVRATGDASGTHHLMEDVAIVLGRALREAIGEGAGITRMGDSTVPLDETLALCAVDLSGRPYAVLDTGLQGQTVEGLPGDMIDHFLETLALEARIALHCRVLYGRNTHHKTEAVFKALARALRTAAAMDSRLGGAVPSTKGSIAS